MARGIKSKVVMSRMMEGMPRYPNTSVMGMCRGLDYAGTSVFAISGSIAAATGGMSILGSTVVGCITALGGGTVRDMLWGKAPVFWLDEKEYLYMSVANASAAFVACATMDPSQAVLQAILFWGDTLGLGAFCVIGTMYAARLGCSYVIIMLCCLVTCTGGGIIRDTLLRRPARVLHAHAEVYAETALGGGSAYMLARTMLLPLQYRALAGMMTCISMRVYASSHDVRMWSLPQFIQKS